MSSRPAARTQPPWSVHLDEYRGALLIVSHDFAFLERIGVEIILELDVHGRMHQRHSLGNRADQV